jgi:alpha-tubulin suppressor-like RCC1 family protein
MTRPHSSFSRVAITIVVGLIVVACVSASSPGPLTAPPRSSPHTVQPPASSSPPDLAITAVSAGWYHVCALTSGGGVKCWGNNSHGQLGNGTTIDSLFPVDVAGLASGVIAVSAGFIHTCALTTNGGVKCWGENDESGRLGNGGTTNSSIPVDVSGLATGITAIAAGFGHTCALTTDGGVKCWGGNGQGELGTDTTGDPSLVPVDVSDVASGVIAIAAGNSFTCALTSGGGVKCWGHDDGGALGDGSTTDGTSPIPVDVVGLGGGISAIALGGAHACALTAGGGVKCWGSNSHGELGDRASSGNFSPLPVDVSGLTGGIGAIAAGTRHTCALTTGGGVKCWGDYPFGGLGDSPTTHPSIPVDVPSLAAGISAIVAGHGHSCALTSRGGVKCWGDNGGIPGGVVPVEVDFGASPSDSEPTSPVSAALPVSGSAREIGLGIHMAPGADGSLFVSIPRPEGAVLALLDGAGHPRPGWPISIEHSTHCRPPMSADDGSVRIVCDGTDLPKFDLDASDVRAFAFDAAGREMTGWRTRLRPGIGSVAGDELTWFAQQYFTDVVMTGTVSHEAWLTTIAASGAVRIGTRVPMLETTAGEAWAIGPDGVAYGSINNFGDSPEAPKSWELVAVGFAGAQRGFPITGDGTASEPAYDAAGRIHLTVETGSVDSPYNGPARTLVFDAVGKAVVGGSGELGVQATDDCVAIEGSCDAPGTPLVGPDGTTFVIEAHHNGTIIVGLSPAGHVLAGWPYRSGAGYQGIGSCCAGDSDPAFNLAAPAISPDNILYLIHATKAPSVGGSIVAVGPDGRVRPGWPVELTRPGAEFWSVVVGSDGTVYALAIEPESDVTSSATILAIASDSTILWATTIIDPP